MAFVIVCVIDQSKHWLEIQIQAWCILDKCNVLWVYAMGESSHCFSEATESPLLSLHLKWLPLELCQETVKESMTIVVPVWRLWL